MVMPTLNSLRVAGKRKSLGTTRMRHVLLIDVLSLLGLEQKSGCVKQRNVSEDKCCLLGSTEGDGV